jgi:hypothetical protein
MTLKARACPRCGAPVDEHDTLVDCKYCGAALVQAVEAPAPPAASVPVAPFGAGRPQAEGTSGSGCALAAVAVVLLVGVGAGAAGFLFLSRSAAPPPPPSPVTVTTSTTVVTTSTTIVTTGDGFELMEARCNAGDAQGCVALGMLHQNGHGGRPVDLVKAREAFDRGCALGNHGGCVMRDNIPKAGGAGQRRK